MNNYIKTGLLLVALTMLVALGGSITLVFQPKSRQEAFSRGLALLAVVTVSTPLQESPGLDDPVRSEVSSFLGVSTAWADVKPLPVGTIELRVYTDVSGVLPQGAQIALRDLSTGRVVARQGLVRSIMTFSRPVGSYRLTVEAPSYETVVVDFAVVLERPATVEVRLYPSSLPGVFQKVLPPNTQKR